MFKVNHFGETFEIYKDKFFDDIKFEVDIETGLRFATEEQYARLHRVKDLRWSTKVIGISK